MLRNLAKPIAAGALAVALAPAAPAAPEIEKLADNVYAMSEMHVTSLVAVGESGVLITDPAFAPRAASLKAAIAELAGKPVTHIVLTHEHYDHVGGTEVFPDAQVICHRACQAVFDLDILGQAPGKVDVTFDDMLEVDFAGPAVTLHHWGPADGAGHAVVHLPEERIAYTADLYEDRALTHGMWMDDGNYLAILRVLRELAKLDLKHAVSAHSVDTSVRIVEENLAFAEDLFALANGAIAEALQQGGPNAVFRGLLGGWPEQLKLPQYAGWEGYEEHFPAHVRRMALSIFHGG